MKYVSLKLKRYAGNVQVVDNDFRSALCKSLIWYLGALAVFYVVFLGSMVFDILERKALQAEARALGSEVGNLELNYLSLSGKIDLEYSYGLGFKEVKPQFTTRKALGSNLSGASGKILVKNEI